MTLSAHLRNVFSDARHLGTSHLVFKMGKRNSSLFCFLSAGKSIEPTAVLGRIFRCTEPQKTVIPKLETRNANILVLRTVHRTCPTRRAFRRSVSATENAPPEKKTFQHSEAATENTRPEKNSPAFRGGHTQCQTRTTISAVTGASPKMPDQKKQHTEQQKKCSGNTCDQKKNILAFTVGHRECATRKKSFRRSGAAIENARPEKKLRTAETNVYEKNRDQNKTCWRSGVALKTCATRKKICSSATATANARPEKNIITSTGQMAATPKNARPEKKNILAFKGNRQTRSIRKLSNI